MKLTRRGQLVLVATVAAIASGALFGARGLNAIAAPGVVALVAAAVQVRRYDPPTLEREVVPKAQRGDSIAVRLHLESTTPFSARVHDTVADRVEPTGATREVTLDETTIRYRLDLTSRGEHVIGPAEVVARDVLGLVSTTYRYPDRDTILVRPMVRLLSGPARDDFILLYGAAGEERGQFDHLRLYERGDPLRDIHWKSSAKQGETTFVVKEFTADEGTRTVEIAAEGSGDQGDPMADATASIAVDLLAAGVRVGLTTPSGRVDPDSGPDQRERILDHLAVADTGRLPDHSRREANIVVSAEGGEPRIDMDGRSCRFADLAGERLADSPPRSAARAEISPPEVPAS